MTRKDKAFWDLMTALEPLMERFHRKPTQRELFDYGWNASEDHIIQLLEATNQETAIAIIQGRQTNE